MQQENYFFIGIKGVAQANLAIILKKQGYAVSGWDTDEEFITDKTLQQEDVSVISKKITALPENVSVVVYSASHHGRDNILVQDAFQKGIKAIHQSELISSMLAYFDTTIGVTGCHGKTTTSGLLAYCLSRLSKDSAHLVGVSKFNNITGGDFFGNKYFTFEADEYALDPPHDKTPKFLKTIPHKAIVTNIDFDHPDVYKNIEEVKNAYFEFMSRVLESHNSLLVLNCSDTYLRNFAKSHSNCLTYGKDSDADLYFKNFKSFEDHVEFKVSSLLFGFSDKPVKLQIFGEHNASNATGVIAMLISLDFKIDDVINILGEYTGPERRLQLIYKKNNTYLFDDYGHHPSEITATLTALKLRFPQKKVVVIFQPHTYSRTLALKSQFARSLSVANKVVLLPIFASARENKAEFEVKVEDIVYEAEKIERYNFGYYEDTKDAMAFLESYLRHGDIVVTMGAGDVYKLKEQIERILNKLQ